MAEQLFSCKNCGTSVPENTVFCPNCGALLRSSGTSTFTGYSSQPLPPPPPPVPYSQVPNVSQQTGNQQQKMAGYPSSPGPQGYPPPYPQNQWSPPPPIDIRPKKQATRGWIKAVGVVGALLLVLGTAGFFARNFVGKGVTNNG